jgi:hypothetical protein
MVKRQPTSSARRAMPSCAGKPACSFGAGRRCTPHSSDLQVQSFSVASASSLTVASSRMVPRDNVRPRMRPRWLSIIMLLPIDGADGEEDMVGPLFAFGSKSLVRQAQRPGVQFSDFCEPSDWLKSKGQQRRAPMESGSRVSRPRPHFGKPGRSFRRQCVQSQDDDPKR